MRDFKRINEILDLIKSIWVKDPDLRFFQLIFNIQSKYSNDNNNFGKIELSEKDGLTKIGYDFFNLEDDEILKYLENINK